MSEWAWVVLGYSVAYGALGAYLAALGVRLSRARRRVGERR